ncbi:hypothetical protein [Paenibacillus paeoniae]|uniref:Uncharacterized protein n=1 Tax=Paenibacillus paeoniae TaxID=2292705 RepID=A0A371PEU4_9BACL|nr:hypothetical protein [Paenibacillus paeoniae]REK74457.1 hypothetical protein DX130_18310 [Paenibacillus paeoniae]
MEITVFKGGFRIFVINRRLLLVVLISWIIGRFFLEMLHFEIMSPTRISQTEFTLMYGFVICTGLLVFAWNVSKYGFKSAKYGIFILLGTLSLLFYLDIGHKYVDQWREERESQKEIQLMNSTQAYYKKNLDPIYSFREYVGYSKVQTYYIFEKNGDVSQKDMDYIVNILKPLDKLDISIQLYSLTTPNELVMRFTNEKAYIGCTNPMYRNLDKINICNIKKYSERQSDTNSMIQSDS